MGITDDLSEQPNIPQQSQIAPLTQPRRSYLVFVDKTFRDVWFYIAAISLVVNFLYTFRPQLSAQVASTQNDDPIATLYSLSNPGAWNLYNIGMTCVIWNGKNKVATLSNNSITTAPNGPLNGNPNILTLPTGHVATRDCGGSVISFRNLRQDSIRIDLDISYAWLWGFRTSIETFHFNTRNVQGHINLVPDIENSNGPST